MTNKEKAFYTKFDQLPADVRNEASDAASEMMLFQAAQIGQEEFLRTAKRLGAEIDIVANFPEKICHYSEKIAA